MKTKAITAGTILSAILASACCLGPLILVGLGVGGIGFAAALSQYRPYFMIITFVFLGTAFYFTYRKPRETCNDGSCVSTHAKRFRKTVLWIVTVVALALMAFPYYSGALLGGQKTGASDEGQEELAMVLKVEGMTCAGCEATVVSAARQTEIVMDAKADYKQGTLEIKWKRQPSNAEIEALIEAVEETGYKVQRPENDEKGK